MMVSQSCPSILSEREPFAPAARPSSRPLYTAARDGGDEHSAAMLVGVGGMAAWEEDSVAMAEDARDSREGVASMSVAGPCPGNTGTSACCTTVDAVSGAASGVSKGCVSSLGLRMTLEPKGSGSRGGLSSRPAGACGGKWGVSRGGSEEASGSCSEACEGACAGRLASCGCSRMLGQALHGGLLHTGAPASKCLPARKPMLSISVPSAEPLPAAWQSRGVSSVASAKGCCGQVGPSLGRSALPRVIWRAREASECRLGCGSTAKSGIVSG